jgi:hypothetical protein
MNIPPWSGVNIIKQPARSKMMIRIMLAAGVFIAAMSFDVRLVKAAEGPWCAIIGMTDDSTYEDCQYRTFEACRLTVLAGNRGFCNHNPRWTSGSAVTDEPRPPRKRRSQQQ